MRDRVVLQSQHDEMRILGEHRARRGRRRLQRKRKPRPWLRRRSPLHGDGQHTLYLRATGGRGQRLHRPRGHSLRARFGVREGSRDQWRRLPLDRSVRRDAVRCELLLQLLDDAARVRPPRDRRQDVPDHQRHRRRTLRGGHRVHPQRQGGSRGFVSSRAMRSVTCTDSTMCSYPLQCQNGKCAPLDAATCN